MHLTLDIFPCDLGEPILIPTTNNRELEHKNVEYASFEEPSVPPQVREADDWADIT